MKQVKFNYPETLENPLTAYEKLLSMLHKKIGKEQLEQRIDVISLEWALQSGYYLDISNGFLEFTHVSI